VLPPPDAADGGYPAQTSWFASLAAPATGVAAASAASPAVEPADTKPSPSAARLLAKTVRGKGDTKLTSAWTAVAAEFKVQQRIWDSLTTAAESSSVPTAAAPAPKAASSWLFGLTSKSQANDQESDRPTDVAEQFQAAAKDLAGSASDRQTLKATIQRALADSKQDPIGAIAPLKQFMQREAAVELLNHSTQKSMHGVVKDSFGSCFLV
ncbi:unnamed protein product, partial [Polarella glacialis]